MMISNINSLTSVLLEGSFNSNMLLPGLFPILLALDWSSRDFRRSSASAENCPAFEPSSVRVAEHEASSPGTLAAPDASWEPVVGRCLHLVGRSGLEWSCVLLEVVVVGSSSSSTAEGAVVGGHVMVPVDSWRDCRAGGSFHRSHSSSALSAIREVDPGTSPNDLVDPNSCDASMDGVGADGQWWQAVCHHLTHCPGNVQ